MTQDEITAVKKAAEKMRKQESAQDEIIRFAIQCRLVTTGNRDGLYMDALTEFAKLVAAKAFQTGYEKGISAFLLGFAEEVRRSGDTRLASMAIAAINKAKVEA